MKFYQIYFYTLKCYKTKQIQLHTFITENNEGYRLKFNAYCKFPNGYTLTDSPTFKTINDVKQRCNAMADCTMFYAHTIGVNVDTMFYAHTIGVNVERFSICPPGSEIKTSHSGSRIYTKGEVEIYDEIVAISKVLNL